MVNWKDGRWYNKVLCKEEVIKRGEIVTSMTKLSQEFKTTRDKIRTWLKILTSIGFSHTQTTNRYTKITIVNYRVYQDKPLPELPQTHSYPTATPQLPHTIEQGNKGTNTHLEGEPAFRSLEPKPKFLPPNQAPNVSLAWGFFQRLNEYYGNTNGDSLEPTDNDIKKVAFKVLNAVPKENPLKDSLDLMDWYFNPPEGAFWANKPKTFGHFSGCVPGIMSHLMENKKNS